MKLVITVEMPEKWVPAFTGMLKRMANRGRKSEKLVFYAEPDFQPKFEVLNDGYVPYPQKPVVNTKDKSSHFHRK